MESLLLKILVIFTSLVAWGVSGVIGYVLFLYRARDREVRLATLILTTLFFVTTYNAFYEGVFLFRGMSLLPTLNYWSLVVLTPLFYMLLSYRLIRTDGKNRWWSHFIIPGGLGLFYLWGAATQLSSDCVTLNWSDLVYRTGEWWFWFRIGCLAGWFVQLLFYIPCFILMLRNAAHLYLFKQIKKEACAILMFYAVMFFALLTPYYFARILYNLSLPALILFLVDNPTFFRIFYHYIMRNRWLSFFYTIHRHGRKLYRQLMRQSFPASDSLSDLKRKPSETDILLRRAMEESFMYRNPDFNIAQLAGVPMTNETYLSRYLNSRLGMSFPEWVNKYRLDEAEQLLRGCDISILEISEYVGFQSLSTFYQTFKSRYHIPPAQWRKKMMS